MKILLTLFIGLLVSLGSQAQNTGPLARVTNIYDGDTFTAIGVHDKIKYKVRLLGVDTPELNHFEQTQGQAALDAKKYLESVLPVGTEFNFGKETQFDKNGRVLAQVVVNGTDINLQMLRDGIGYFYFIAPFSKRILNDYSAAAAEGFYAQKGVFSGKYSDLKESYVFRMDAQRIPSKNLVGNLASKELFNPDKMNLVPVFERVFFLNEEQAIRLGYHRR